MHAVEDIHVADRNGSKQQRKQDDTRLSTQWANAANRVNVRFCLRLSMAARAAYVIDHDKVRGFPDSTSGFLKTFQPFLKVIEGCVPFPAVDAAGNVSGGLKPSGMWPHDGCSRNLGQIYVRAREYQGECAVMYSWFFPKEQIPDWPYAKGSRYDWEHVVVWLTSCDSEAQVNAVAMIVTTS
ncbi:hypothetical protein ACVMIX_005048 [Rhizobium leguminosarum]|nr:hypothetical protein [Rhizobium leguminosarum]